MIDLTAMSSAEKATLLKCYAQLKAAGEKRNRRTPPAAPGPATGTMITHTSIQKLGG